VHYKNTTLPHKFFADFVVMDKIFLEIKSMSGLADEHMAQTMNYLKVSGNRLGLLVNFGQPSLQYKRIVI